MRVTLGFAAVTIWLLLAPLGARSETKELKTGAFQIVQEVVLPASPEAVYDAATGDISGWWDHHVSDHPKKLYIEAKPGGGFWEIFDDSGDGVLHATVIYAERGASAFASLGRWDFLARPSTWSQPMTSSPIRPARSCESPATSRVRSTKASTRSSTRSGIISSSSA